MDEQYLTITKNGQLTVTIKKSRFICQLFRIENEEQAKAALNQVRSAESKANHHCFAYLLGDSNQIQRMSDDGEPTGTAGEPILTALQQNQVHDVIAVVTRYFGGIKLGASGLIRAYNGTTAQAIQKIGRVLRVQQTLLTLDIAYSQVDTLNYFLNEQGIQPQSVTYLANVQFLVPVNTDQLADFKTAVLNLLKGQVTINEQHQQFNEIPFTD